MPNWCSTRLEISGNSGELSRFLVGLKKDESGTFQILESYYPTPKALVETPARFADTDEGLIAQQAENIANYGHADWYNWACDKWGTKWGDCNTRLVNFTKSKLTFFLQSAWSPITTGLLEVSTQFPELTFVMFHDEEGGFYLCAEVIRNGRELWEFGCSPAEDYVWGDAENPKQEFDEHELYEEWKDERLKEYADMVMTLFPETV